MDDEEILRCALEGDSWAYERLGERMARELQRFFQARYRGDVGFELAQRCVLRILNNLDSAPRSSIAFSGWILAYAHIQVRRWLTSLARENRRAQLRVMNMNVFELGRHFDEAQFGAEEHCELIMGIIDELPDKLRDVMLARLAGSTYIEIAKAYGISDRTASRRDQAARERVFRQWMAERVTRTTFQTTKPAARSSSSEK